jgi:hypothetical protein
MKIRSKKLNIAVNEFVKALKQRLAQKERQGYIGWNDDTIITTSKLEHQIEDDVFLLKNTNDGKLYEKACLDIAARSMMLWNRVHRQCNQP